MDVVAGVDTSYARLTAPIARDLWVAGVRVYAQCLWTGSEQPPLRVENLRLASQQGFALIGYISVEPGMGGAWHVDKGRAGVPDDLWDALALAPVDCERPGIVAPEVRAAVERTVALGKRRALYTSYGFWRDHMGDSQAFGDCLLWNAWWDGDPDADFPAHPYGPWRPNQVVGEQWSNGTNVLGLFADRDMFDLGLLTPGGVMDDATKERLAEEALIRMMAGAVLGDNMELLVAQLVLGGVLAPGAKALKKSIVAPA